MGKLESLSIKQTTTSSNVEINKTTLLDVKTTNKEDNDFDSTSSLEEEEFYKLTNAEENQWDELAEQLETLYIRSTMEAEERVTVDELVVESLAAKWKMKGKEVEEECLK
jgi:hypothetical protein